MSAAAKCNVMYGRDHLATIWLLPDGRWTLEPTETHLPVNLLQHIRLFDVYVGPQPPPLVQDWQLHTGTQLDPRDPIGTLVIGSIRTPAGTGIRFVR